MKKSIAICMTLLLAFGLLVPALAAGEGAGRKKPPAAIDTTAAVSLKVSFAAQSKRNNATLRFEGIDVSIYRVAEISSAAEYTVTDTFSRFWPVNVDLNETMDGDTLRKLANNTLKANVYENDITPTGSGKTGPDGSVTFEKLEQGLYLVLAKQPGKDGDDSYKPTANLISLPTSNADSSAWVYDVETNIKYTYEAAPEQPDDPVPSPTPSEKPEESPKPSEEPEESPKPSEEPEPTPTPTPEPTEEPEETPEPTEEPMVTPEPTEEPVVTPEPTEKPNSFPTQSEKPQDDPEPPEEPEPGEPPEEPEEIGSTNITAHKMWDDGDNDAGERPSQIVVHLWCDGERYDEVTLTAANGWTVDWEELPDGHDWVVSERVVSGYSLSLDRAGATYVMVNTFDEELFELDEAGVPRGWRDSEEEEYEDFGDEVPRGRLAQTGMIWWPVMLLAGAGVLCCIAGFLILRKRSE